MQCKGVNTNRNRYGVCNRKMRWCKNRSSESWSRSGKDRVAGEISNPYVRRARFEIVHLDNLLLRNVFMERCIMRIPRCVFLQKEDVCRYEIRFDLEDAVDVDIPVRGVRARRARILIISLKYLHSNTVQRRSEGRYRSDGGGIWH